jgi:hypothetical protein
LTNFTKSAVLTATLSLCVLMAARSSAQTLSGTITNGTSNKPAAGDEVILINISNGMDVAANTKADANGKFSFTLKDGPGGPHLIRAVHQGVTYHQMAPPGTSNVDVKVYDVSKKITGLGLTADVLRLQADGTTLHGIRLFAVDNTSSPAVTQMNDHNFEFYLPAGAKIEQVQAKAPNGQPISAETTPQAEKNRYAIVFPLRPGETQFQLEFTMPYSGSAKIDPKPLYPAEHMVVVLPKSMKFEPADSSLFKSMQDPGQSDSVVQVAQQVHAGQALGFTVSGTGTISDQPAQVSGAGMGGGAEQASAEGRPGGGLGAPIDTPDPLEKYRWPIIGAFIVLLGIGGWIVTKRQTAQTTPSPGSSPAARAASAPTPKPAARPVVTAAATSSAPVGSTTSGALLEGLKEELFQLEVERQQGKITQAEYERAKNALDHTLERALKRQG